MVYVVNVIDGFYPLSRKRRPCAVLSQPSNYQMMASHRWEAASF